MLAEMTPDVLSTLNPERIPIWERKTEALCIASNVGAAGQDNRRGEIGEIGAREYPSVKSMEPPRVHFL
jgi:hypothetical protein